MAQIGTYILFFKAINKFYVGSSQDVDKRVERHYNELQQQIHHNSHVQEAWNTYGPFIVEVIPANSREHAYEIEQSFIQTNIESGNILNIGVGVRGGDNLTYNPQREEIIGRMKETINENMSRLTEQERIQKWSMPGPANGMYGKTHTSEARAIMSAASVGNTRSRGRVSSEETKEKISAFAKTRTGDLNSFFGKEHSQETKDKLAAANKGRLPPNTLAVSIDGVVYDSLSSAARALGVVTATILFRLKSNNPRFKDYFHVTSMPND